MINRPDCENHREEQQCCKELQSSGRTQDTETNKKRERCRGDQLETFMKIQRIKDDAALGKIPPVDTLMEEAQEFLVAGMMEMCGYATQSEKFRSHGDEAGGGKQEADGEASPDHNQNLECRSRFEFPRHRRAIKRVGGEKAKGIGDFLQEAPNGKSGDAQGQSDKRPDQVARPYSADGKHRCREQDESEIRVVDLRDTVNSKHG
jgi:hypothetical protein